MGLQGIRIIKFYAWERYFGKRVDEARKKELKFKRFNAMVNGANTSILDIGPLVAALLTFLTYSYTSDEPLTPGKAFTALALFDILRLPLLVSILLS